MGDLAPLRIWTFFMTLTLGIVRAAGPQASIAGGPTPLLQTGSGTLLERAIRKLRDLGLGTVLTTIHEQQEPVAAQARRQGADLLLLPTGETETLPWIVRALPVPETLRSSGTRVLLLQVDAPLIGVETLARLLSVADEMMDGEAMGEADADPRLLVPVAEGGALEPDAAGALLLVFPRGYSRSEATDMGDAIARLAPIPVPVNDRHATLRIRDLPTYRRHFPDAFRRRFQKW